MWLADNLIADGRLDEARSTIDVMKNVQETYHYPMYLAMISEKQGNLKQAEIHWQEMLSTYQSNSYAWFVYADDLVKHARYNEAIAAFEKSFELAEKPRMTDALDSIAQIQILLGNKQAAIDAYQRMLQIMKEEWQLTEGETIEGYLKNIELLKK